jgi:hypothetical protein
MRDNFDYYRVKTEWTAENKEGGLVKSKTEELVYASSYTEAEKAAYALAESQGRGRFSDIGIEIVKTKITELLYGETLAQEDGLVAGLVVNYFEEADDTGTGLYAVKLMYISIDEKSGKEKRTNETIHVPASSNAEAARFVQGYLKAIGETRDFIVRDTKFDKAEAILWPADTHQSKVKQQTVFNAR